MDENDSTVSKGSIAITIDVQMPENSPIQAVRSPSHPIAVALGRTSASESLAPHLSRASATLSLSTSTLDKEFILEIIHQVGSVGVISSYMIHQPESRDILGERGRVSPNDGPKGGRTTPLPGDLSDELTLCLPTGFLSFFCSYLSWEPILSREKAC